MRVLGVQSGGQLEVVPLSSYLFPPYLVEADLVELWHPEASLNEVRAEALTDIPAGSRVTVGGYRLHPSNSRVARDRVG